MAKAKKKDFEKQKLKVGKKRPEKANATNTSFQTKSIVVQSQLKAPTLGSYLSLVRHHHAPTRRQAVSNIADILHEHKSESSEIFRSIASLMVDADHNVRLALLALLQSADSDMLAPSVPLLAAHVHAAMTHITASIRADSTLFLNVLLQRFPAEFVRSAFAKTLTLYFPLLGWPTEGRAQSGVVSATLSLGKLAPKARTQQLQTLHKLLTCGLTPPHESTKNLWHLDTVRFLLPPVPNPFDAEVADDVEARIESVETVKQPLLRGLALCTQEGGEIGRAAARVCEVVQSI